MTFRPDIDPKSGKIDEPIKLDGAPEFLAVDGSGKATSISRTRMCRRRGLHTGRSCRAGL